MPSWHVVQPRAALSWWWVQPGLALCWVEGQPGKALNWVENWWKTSLEEDCGSPTWTSAVLGGGPAWKSAELGGKLVENQP